MKKIIALLLILVLSVVLAACATGGEEEEEVVTIRPSSIVEPTSTEPSSAPEVVIEGDEYDDGYGFMDEYYDDSADDFVEDTTLEE